MTIPDRPYSGCDCCGYGFEFFQIPSDPYWYLSTLTSGSTEIYKLLRSNLSVFASSAFADAGTVCQIDSQGNFYSIVGTALKKYSFDGTLLWSFVAPPPASSSPSSNRIDVDSNLNVYVVGISGSSLRLQKINSSGSLVWTYDKAPVAGPAGTSTSLGGAGVCVDLLGNVHVTGLRVLINTPEFTSRLTGRCEIHVDSDGNELWTDISTDTSQGPHESHGLQCVCDEDGNVIVRMLSFRSLGGGGATTDNITLKGYDSSGNLLFSHVKPGVGTGTESEFPSCELIRYYNGNLYACGPTSNTGETESTWFRKFNGSDYTNEVWHYDPPVIFKRTPNFAIDRTYMYAHHQPDTFTPTRSLIIKLNLADGSLVDNSTLLGEISFFAMVPPGNPIQFFR